MNTLKRPSIVAMTVLASFASPARTAPTCPRPVSGSSVASITAGNCFYELAVGNGIVRGSGVARTGEQHPVTLALGRPVTTGSSGGVLLSPAFNGFSIRSWDSGTDYLLDGDYRTLLDDGGWQCFPARLLPPPIVEEIARPDGQVVGVRQTFSLAERGDELVLVLEAIAHGTTFEDSAVELSATVTNQGSASTRVGLRQWSDSAVFTVSGHACAFMPPDPPAEPWHGREADWLAPRADQLLLSITDAPSSVPYYYFAGLSVAGPWPLSPPATPPDRIAFSHDAWSFYPADRGGPGNTCFAWDLPMPPRGGPGSRSVEALAYFWGGTDATAIYLAPGESTTIRVWTWAFIENPVTCVAAGPPGPVECAGAETPVALDGSGSFTQDGNPLLYRWSSADPLIRFDDPSSPTPVAYLPGVGMHEVVLDVGIGPYTRSASLEVEVVDTTPPALTIAPPIVLRTSDFPGHGCTAPAARSASAIDACDPSVAITHVTMPDVGIGGAVASHDFPLGTTRIVFTATDEFGNTATGETSVTLVDDVPPTLLVTATPASLWPPNHRMRDIHVEPQVDDDCDASPMVVLSSVTSSESPDRVGDGAFQPDIEGADLGSPDFDFLLRAERSGRGVGRQYTARYTATDAQGNAAAATVTIGVAHDQGRRR